MKTYLRLVAVLTLTCLFWTALLASVNALTRDRIAAASQQREVDAARNVIPPDAPAPQLRPCGSGTNYLSLAADGSLVAAAIKTTSPNGYAGNVTLMVGLTAAGTLHSYELLEAAETPGLGSKIASPQFMSSICGKPLTTRWLVTKDGGEIDAITAATISSRAALEAIAAAIAEFETIKQELATP